MCMVVIPIDGDSDDDDSNSNSNSGDGGGGACHGCHRRPRVGTLAAPGVLSRRKVLPHAHTLLNATPHPPLWRTSHVASFSYLSFFLFHILFVRCFLFVYTFFLSQFLLVLSA